MSATAPAAAVAERPLQYLPVGLFGSVMGLTGLSTAWRQAHALFGVPGWIHHAIGALAVLAFVALLAAYGVKLACAPDAVRAEFNHPVASNLFGTILISLLLLPIVLAPVALRFAQVMWGVGAILMLLFAWLTVDRWINDVLRPEQATPAWLVPVVGLLDVPLAMPALALPPELDVVKLGAFAIGLFFAGPLFTLLMTRLVFEAPMAPQLQATLLILIAPFSVGMAGYLVVTQRFDLFAEALFLLTLFMLAILLGRLRFLVRCCPFRMTWWAVSFPLASVAVAAMQAAQAAHHPMVDDLAIAMLAFASAVIAWLTWRTLAGIARGELKTLSTA